ncbi:MAG: class I SAM-dependent RNA methyltransferase [Myxococcales bacterium]
MPKVVLQIDSLARGEAVARRDGQVVFVPGAAPGDTVEVEVPDSAESAVRASLLRVLEPSPSRREPGCPHFGRCGGCQWLHVDEDAQARAKEALFYDALRRIGGIDRARLDAHPLVRSRTPLHYRQRAKLHLKKGALGYAALASHELVELTECRLLSPLLEAALLRIKAALPAAGVPSGATDLSVATDGRRVSAAFHGAAPSKASLERATKLMRAARLDGVLLAPESGPLQAVGEVLLRQPAPLADGVTLYGRPDLFAQANPETNPELVRRAVEGLGDARRVLELYAGAGNFTFAMAARGQEVTAVEYGADALELARRSAREAKLTNVRFMQGDSLKLAAALAREGQPFDAVLLDPPRIGAKGIAKALGPLGAKRIVYVSCDPATLARDAKELEAAGYVAVEAVPVDMFPQTFHVEGVLRLERR